MRETVALGLRTLREDGLSEACRAASRQLHRTYYGWRNGPSFNAQGVDIHDEDWDNLIILDACRYDTFEACHRLDGRLERRTSRGSTSREFIAGNFASRQLYDTVYLSDNPWYGRLYDEIDSELYHFSLCPRDAFDGIVTHPETVTDAAVEYDERFPDKRLVVHYMQPHAPYFDAGGAERYRWPADGQACDPDELERAYRENLELALTEVERLLESLTGQTVVTADHGELLGERLLPCPFRQFQHPGGVYVEELVTVPWLVVDGGERKQIVEADEPADWEFENPQEAAVERQLEALGYV